MQKKKETKDELTLYWNAFLAGNDDAFSKIYKTLIRELFSYGTTLSSDKELIKDCIQDIFLEAFQNRAQLTAVKNIKVYLMIALRNALVDSFRKNQTHQRFIDTCYRDEPTDDSEEERIIAEEADMELRLMTEQCLSALPKRQQEIIRYRFEDDMTYEEIAKLLNINYQSVANSIQKSFKILRDLYLKRGYKQ